ncbi:hypothetical protein [Halomonas sp. NO4]|uniref:hypothetical protein n=1 Tax=Halomonas sp. NO4 TaxID=2484813 RepID=UPI0013D4F80B|nr:hypothetical protein [Halomonas sp. NO4]
MHFATLGPAGSNHELVLHRYLSVRRLTGATVHLVDTFDTAFRALVDGDVDFVLQCTAHPSHGDCVGRFMHRAFPVDTFIAGSKPLAVLARAEVSEPRTIGLQPATRYYSDLSGYAEQIEEPTIVSVAEGLLAGHYEAGLCAREVLDTHPQRLRLVADLGPALDAWVLFGREKLSEDPVIWPQAPVVRQLHP